MDDADHFYDVTVDVGTHDRSALAIMARRAEGELIVQRYIENFKKSLRHFGRVALDLVKTCYDRPRRHFPGVIYAKSARARKRRIYRMHRPSVSRAIIPAPANTL